MLEPSDSCNKTTLSRTVYQYSAIRISSFCIQSPTTSPVPRLTNPESTSASGYIALNVFLGISVVIKQRSASEPSAMMELGSK